MKYNVSLTVLWTTEVEADSPEKAIDLAIKKCPYTLETSIPANVKNEANHNWFIEYWRLK